jgi:hypothetical protein
MLSATTAESSDSRAPSNAREKADGRSAIIVSILKLKKVIFGTWKVISENLSPIVSTGILKTVVNTVMSTRAAKIEGIFFETRGIKSIIKIVAMPIASDQ